VASEVRFGEVKALLERHGWTLRRVSGSHHIFKKEGDRMFSVPVHRGKVKPGYVREIKDHVGEK
jgi:predicted RNA binding protein YcfA (HicA-like mRNA interferase family)